MKLKTRCCQCITYFLKRQSVPPIITETQSPLFDLYCPLWLSGFSNLFYQYFGHQAGCFCRTVVACWKVDSKKRPPLCMLYCPPPNTFVTILMAGNKFNISQCTQHLSMQMSQPQLGSLLLLLLARHDL